MTKYSDIQHMPDIERTYTADDLAQLLRTTRAHIYALCRRGQIPDGVKYGGARRWPAHQVRAMLGLTKRGDV